MKKSGKSALAGLVARWLGETQLRFGQIYATGNDAEQARDRGFKAAKMSIELTPGFKHGYPGVLPGRWQVQDLKLLHQPSGTVMKPLSVDYRGEAGSNPNLSIFTELWGYDHEDARRFWEEMTPVPTQEISLRLVETYAGYDGESELLATLYKLGLEGHQMTAQELADASGEPLDAFSDVEGPDSLVPIWVHPGAGLFMYWDSGLRARRMPWQLGEKGEAYYREQEQILHPRAYLRLHSNEWVGAQSSFVPIELWDACREDLPPLDEHTPIVLGVDAATTGDCFGIVATSRHPVRPKDPAIRAARKWAPPEGGRIDYSECEAWIRECVARYNVVQIAYDQYQLEDMMQRLRREGIVWCQQFNQQGDRLVADRQLYDCVIQKRLAHTGHLDLREHIQNANAKLQKDEDSKMRIVKKAAGRPVDLAVAASMSVARCLYLNL